MQEEYLLTNHVAPFGLQLVNVTLRYGIGTPGPADGTLWLRFSPWICAILSGLQRSRAIIGEVQEQVMIWCRSYSHAPITCLTRGKGGTGSEEQGEVRLEDVHRGWYGRLRCVDAGLENLCFILS